MSERLRVLLVEDNPGDVRLVREMLNEAGASLFELSHVDRLSLALDFLADRPIDVMLLDLSLPDTSGLSTLIEVQTLCPDLPIVVLSGLNDEAIALQAVHDGAQDYLVKGQGSSEVLTRALRYAVERKSIEKRLAYLAQYDPLTDLPNRILFRERLGRATKRAARTERPTALMLLDLDHFKDINDSLGHDFGDRLLQAVAERLQRCVRANDTIARLGGDEFTVIIEDVTTKEEVATVAQKIIDALAQPLSLNGHDLFITASVGIALSDGEDADVETVIKQADMALYAAKERGRGNYRFYENRMNTVVARRMTIANSLRRAVEREEFVLHYQPQFDVASGRLTGVEALLRWQHPEHGLVSPAQFVHLLEENGLIVQVGAWALHTACAQRQAWQRQGLPLRMSVNLSPRQVRRNQLVHTVREALANTGMDPCWLQLEVTESLLLNNSGETLATLRGLLATGVKLSIDDFGTGYSSLSYLRRFPFHAIKVDRSFVKDIATDADGAAIVAAVITLAHSLRLKVVAEGVELPNQMAFLTAKGCDEVQGYLLSAPMGVAAFDAWLALRTGEGYHCPLAGAAL